ncbi:hypothetical protein BYT27DRAFT_7263713 [Phlegmacium glaucopus]|nr:hypothetical protein BYT27DRAFT_7263713 [Phlegmacium glaucopus]
MKRRFAEEKWDKRFTDAAAENYREMGLLSLSVVVYTLKSGQTAINIHEEIASNLGVRIKGFEQMHQEKALDMKRAVLEYVKVVQNMKVTPAGTGTGTQTGTLSVQLDPDGFPILTCPTSWEKITKEDMERLFRAYITDQYRLAARDKERQAPFGRLSANSSDFVEAKYLPPAISLSDPRSMKREALIQFFQHITARQTSHGIQDAFRFKAVLSSRKQGSLRTARYVNTIGDDPAPARRKKNRMNTSTHRITETLATNISDITQGMAHSFNPNDSLMPMLLQEQLIPEHPGPSVMPSLTLDPAFNIDPPLILDPLLDPAMDSNVSFTTLMLNALPDMTCPGPQLFGMATPGLIDPKQLSLAPSGPSCLNLALDLNAKLARNATTTRGEVSPWRKGKTAENLAIEEAKKYGAKGKHRR